MINKVQINLKSLFNASNKNRIARKRWNFDNIYVSRFSKMVKTTKRMGLIQKGVLVTFISTMIYVCFSDEIVYDSRLFLD